MYVFYVSWRLWEAHLYIFYVSWKLWEALCVFYMSWGLWEAHLQVFYESWGLWEADLYVYYVPRRLWEVHLWFFTCRGGSGKLICMILRVLEGSGGASLRILVFKEQINYRNKAESGGVLNYTYSMGH